MNINNIIISENYIYWICISVITLIFLLPIVIILKKIKQIKLEDFNKNYYSIRQGIVLVISSILILLLYCYGYSGLLNLGFLFNRVRITPVELILSSPFSKSKVLISDIKCVNIISEYPSSPFMTITLNNGKEYDSVGTSKENVLESIYKIINEKINCTSQP